MLIRGFIGSSLAGGPVSSEGPESVPLWPSVFCGEASPRPGLWQVLVLEIFMSGTSPRPELILDRNVAILGQGSDVLGRDGPRGRRRLVLALPVPGRLVRRSEVVVDPGLGIQAQVGYLGSADGSVLGNAGVWVARVLDAGDVIDTRSLG